MAGTPTPQQIETVLANLKNLQDFNDYVRSNASLTFLNAFALLTETDDSDPGLALMLNFVESSIKAIASVIAPPIGGFAGNFLAGMVASWASNTPPSLNGQFASYVTRYKAASDQVDLQLATYSQDPATYWDTAFTNPENGQSATVGDLANGKFPAKGKDPSFYVVGNAAGVLLDRNLWQSMLVSNFQIAEWNSLNGPDFTPGGSPDNPPVQEVEGFYAVHPAYYEPWTWQPGSSGCGGQQAGWLLNQSSVGRNASPDSDGALNPDACRYLFSDSVPGVVINSNGLFTREDVFTKLGIPEVQVYVDLGAPTADKVSTAYLRAVKEGRTLSALIAKEGREAVEEKIIAKAHEDPQFKRGLARRPRETVEEFLNIKLPEIVAFHVVVENPRSFGIVIPYALYDEPKK
jgi:hypothetical protein